MIIHELLQPCELSGLVKQVFREMVDDDHVHTSDCDLKVDSIALELSELVRKQGESLGMDLSHWSYEELWVAAGLRRQLPRLSAMRIRLGRLRWKIKAD